MKYLTFIFRHLPGEDIKDPEVLETYMPWDDEVKEVCKRKQLG